MLYPGTARHHKRRIVVHRHKLSLLLLSATALASAAMAEPAQLVVINAHVFTMDDRQPTASAVAFEGGVIVAVGTNADALALAGEETQIIDGHGRTIVPGFIDSHMHPRPQFDEMGPFGTLDLSPEGGVTSRAELFEKIRKKIALTPAGQLIKGMSYNDNLVGGHPTAAELDVISPDHPVILVHSSGHRRVVNTAALNAAGITKTTPNPPNGVIERGADGEATGIILELVPNFAPLYEAAPKPGEAETLDAYRKEFRSFLSYGLVSVADAGASPESIAIYRSLLQEGMPVRIYALTHFAFIDWLIENRSKNEWQVPGLTLKAVKVFHGNSLSGRTAWLYKPYAHDPDYYGFAPARDQEKLSQMIGKINAAGLQAAVHSNGDREIDMTLTAVESAQADHPRPNARHRIEHGSVTSPKILKRMKDAAIALAPHSYVLNHGEKMEDYGPERWEYMHANRSAIDLGIPIGGNSDHPVSPPVVMQRIQSLVTRRARSNGKVYGASQRITVDEALRTWTVGSAYLQFEEDRYGSITVGKRGDIVILQTDPHTVDPDAIESIAVDYTIIGGEVAYRRASASEPEYYKW